MKIATVKIIEVNGRATIEPNPGRGVDALDIYEEWGSEATQTQDRIKAERRITHRFVKLETDEGCMGMHGPISLDQALMIKRNYAHLVIGRDPFHSNQIWDIMYRSNRHGINGMNMMALSAVDNALWDLKGKILNLPVHTLLGGTTRDRIEIYASLYPTFDYEPMQQRAAALKAKGFRHQKWFFRYGPGNGKEGVTRNIIMARKLREAVGDDVRLMFDCRRAWDVDFAVDVCRGIEKYDPYWIEEPFSVHELDAYRQLRKRTSVSVATGEHFFTRWETKPYCDELLLDYLQTDPEWCGGISELNRIAAMTQVYSIKLVAHGHLLRPALHVALSQSPSLCPLCEFIAIEHQEVTQWFLKDYLSPVDGYISAPAKPGLGMELDMNKIEDIREINFPF
jgi:L-alanine-DL-glutamate epimerase-like enolase superfamily enzyme